LDNDAILKQFEEIEQKVDKLIGVCKSFEETKLELTSEIERLEKELHGKVEEESRYAEEKALIRSKVDSLLARLEDVTEG